MVDDDGEWSVELGAPVLGGSPLPTCPGCGVQAWKYTAAELDGKPVEDVQAATCAGCGREAFVRIDVAELRRLDFNRWIDDAR